MAGCRGATAQLEVVIGKPIKKRYKPNPVGKAQEIENLNSKCCAELRRLVATYPATPRGVARQQPNTYPGRVRQRSCVRVHEGRGGQDGREHWAQRNP